MYSAEPWADHRQVHESEVCEGLFESAPGSREAHEGQVRSFAYDGHGRLETRTTPEQGTTTYAYPDETTQTVTDARGVTATYGYNNRHLLTSINYNVQSNVATTPNVTFTYDAAGNRTSMTDGLGSVSYGYNQLSQVTSETRSFIGLGSYNLGYSYNLAGELNGMTNPAGVWVGYSYDNTGRMNRVHGAGYANVSTYAYDIAYRAFGAVKSMSFGDHRDLTTAYDNRMRPVSWNVSGVLGYNYAYDYYSEHTGRVTYAQNIASGSPPTNGAPDPTLDRSYQYDQVGALVVAHSGAEARASAYSGQWGTMDGPYSHGYDYDKFGNLTHRYGWGGEVQGGAPGQSSDLYYTYSNNKNQRDGFTYDAVGNLTNDVAQTYSYDATGQQRSASSNTYLIQQGYDGDGLRGQKIENGVTTWYVRSSVLGGQVVAEMDGSGNWSRGYVYAGGTLLAVQQSGSVNWVHEDAATKSKRVTDIYGNIVSTVELDPWAGDTNRSSNSAFQPQQFTSYVRDANGGQDAMARRYATSSARFAQPDPYGGSYDYASPQSFNRYAYAGNDPVNFRDPSGLDPTWYVDALPPDRLGYDGSLSTDTGIMIVDMGATDGAGGTGGPQNPTMVPIGGTDGLKKLLEQTSSGCKAAVQKLISTMASQTGVEASHTNPLELFNALTSQIGGGGVYVDVPAERMNNYVPEAARTSQPAGGSGLSWIFGSSAGPQRISVVFIRGTFSRDPAEFERLKFSYLVTGIHEVTHNAPRSGGYYDHPEMNKAARTLRAKDFDDYIEKHCIPSKYWSKP